MDGWDQTHVARIWRDLIVNTFKEPLVTSSFKTGDLVTFVSEESFVEGVGSGLADGKKWSDTFEVVGTAGPNWVDLKSDAERPLVGVFSWRLKLVETPVAYFDKKHDAGKRDYTLLPADAVSLVLDRETELLDDENLVYGDEDDSLSASLEQLFDSRLEPHLDTLLDAYVFSCRGRVVESLDGVVAVLEHGAKKYARDSWLTVPDAANRYFSAACRHAHAISKGVRLDEDSGLNHWDHLRCNILFLIGLRLAK